MKVKMEDRYPKLGNMRAYLISLLIAMEMKKEMDIKFILNLSCLHLDINKYQLLVKIRPNKLKKCSKQTIQVFWTYKCWEYVPTLAVGNIQVSQLSVLPSIVDFIVGGWHLLIWIGYMHTYTYFKIRPLAWELILKPETTVTRHIKNWLYKRNNAILLATTSFTQLFMWFKLDTTSHFLGRESTCHSG